MLGEACAILHNKSAARGEKRLSERLTILANTSLRPCLELASVQILSLAQPSKPLNLTLFTTPRILNQHQNALKQTPSREIAGVGYYLVSEKIASAQEDESLRSQLAHALEQVRKLTEMRDTLIQKSNDLNWQLEDAKLLASEQATEIASLKEYLQYFETEEDNPENESDELHILRQQLADAKAAIHELTAHLKPNFKASYSPDDVLGIRKLKKDNMDLTRNLQAFMQEHRKLSHIIKEQRSLSGRRRILVEESFLIFCCESQAVQESGSRGEERQTSNAWHLATIAAGTLKLGQRSLAAFALRLMISRQKAKIAGLNKELDLITKKLLEA